MRFEEFKKEVQNLSLYAEGWRGYIYVAFWQGKKVSVKVAKSELVVGAIQKEAKILENLRGLKGFPQILFSGEDFFIYSFIEGTPYRELHLGEKEDRRILKRVLELAFLLDKKGIKKEEFANIDKNVLVSDSGEVYMVDFERGSFSGRASNLTQLLQLLRRKGILTKEESIELGKRYREDMEGVFRQVRAKLE